MSTELTTTGGPTFNLPVAVEMSMLERMARDPAIDVAKIEKLMDMQERSENRQAEAAFNGAMARAQQNIVPVIKNARNEHTRSNYATLSMINKAIMPVYSAEGLAVSFDTAKADIEGYTRHIAIVFHAQGHSRQYHIDMPPEGLGIAGKTMMTATHATGSSSSYARRYLICMIFNVSTEDDNDGNGSGKKEMDADILKKCLASIAESSNMDTLKTTYLRMYTLARDSGDKSAMEAVISAMNTRKNALNTIAACETHAEAPGNPNMVPPAKTKAETTGARIKEILAMVPADYQNECTALVQLYAQSQNPKMGATAVKSALEKELKDSQGNPGVLMQNILGRFDIKGGKK